MNVALEKLQAALHEILAAHPAGLSEYDLLKTLTAHDVDLFDGDYFSNLHGLYQRHFLLFHILYRLRDNLRASGTGDLNIHCLDIRLMPCCDTPSGHPAVPDPLENYYRELRNLESTTEADVLQMLGDFWKRFAGFEQRDEALAVLELAPPASYPDIRRQYRRLAMQWHPDRGGDPEQFQRLEWAMGVLRACYPLEAGT